jgi:hypothetical protein
MSTTVDIYYPDRVTDDEFFKTLDDCFIKIGFQVGKSFAYHNTMALVHIKKSESVKNDLIKIDHWPPTGSIPQESEHLSAEYSPGGGEGFSFDISIFYADNGSSNRTVITSSYPPTSSGVYDLLEVELITRLQHVSVLIYDTLNAGEMNCHIKHGKGPVFYVNPTEENLCDFSTWKIREAYHDSLEFANWAENPGMIIEWDGIDGLCTPYSTKRKWKPEVPISFDCSTEDFYLRYVDDKGNHRMALLRYSITSMGGAAPYTKSQRDDLFYAPARDELDKFQAMTWKATCMEDIENMLGKPDMILPAILYDDGFKAEEYYDVTKQFVYTNISKTSVVIFQEYENHLILVLYAGKEKG